MTTIGTNAFYNCTGLTSVTLGNSVTSIGSYAFYGCTALTKITSLNPEPPTCAHFSSVPTNGTLYVPEGSKNAYASAKVWKDFTNIIELDASGTPSNFEVDGIFYKVVDATAKTVEVTYSGDSYSAVANEYAGNVVIPSTVTLNGTTYTVTSIGEHAFSQCLELTSVTIPNTINSIGYEAFSDCTGLTEVNISDLSAWCKIDFGDDQSSNPLCYAGKLKLNGEEITNLVIPSDITEIKNYAFSGCTSLTSVSIHNSITTIGDMAFLCCTGLTTAIIGNSVTTIGYAAFSGCTGLTEINLPKSIISGGFGGNHEFSDCSNLLNITIDDANAYFCSVDGVIYSEDKTKLVCYPPGRQGAYVIPETTTTVGKCAFYICEGLTDITISNSVTLIGDDAFALCTGLKSVTIPNSVTKIGNKAFMSCINLISVTIGSSVTEIGNWTFYECTGLTEITSLNPEPPICGYYVFYSYFIGSSISTNCTLYVPTGSKNAYASANVWKDFTNIIELPTGIDKINASQAIEVARYDLHGRLLTDPTPGINIVIYSDGTTRKEFVK